jgi:hypothetical protein
MKKNTVLYIILTVITVLALTSVAADFSGRKFTTTLTGAAEIPGPGDPDGTGTAKIWLNHGQSEVCWEISVSEIAPVTAAHIHAAPSGVAGPVVVPLFPPLPDSDGFSRGCISADRELINAIIQSPEQYYVNVHNAEFPAGALRGQLSK